MRKRPVSLRQLEEVTQSVERELRNLGISEVKSDMIGEIVMEELRDIDDVLTCVLLLYIANLKI